MQTFKTSKSRENILSNIRRGLNELPLPMPFPDAEKDVKDNLFAQNDLTVEEIFADAFIKLGGKFVFCDNEQAFVDNVTALYKNRAWELLLCADKQLLNLFHHNEPSIVQLADPAIENAEACITGCEVLVARTGSLILSSRQYMGRSSSVFYPVHIVVAYASQVVPDIEQGIELIKKRYGNNLPSMINLNTGPSRTADIEKTLVVGVHGPAEVFCFFINV